MHLILVGISLIFALLVFRLGYRDGDWHWGAALAAAAIPVAFTFFLGIIGILVAIAFTVAVWKAVSI